MNKKELLEQLKNIKAVYAADPQQAHLQADQALVRFINDPEIFKAWDEIDKWYS